ncbi:uncharacterized protein [Rhodnius prolixus]|uniref:uncharacterized protein n=1 Tax=Rhodnius prolixus TaxID=13249 RepID=UPI003D18C9E8
MLLTQFLAEARVPKRRMESPEEEVEYVTHTIPGRSQSHHKTQLTLLWSFQKKKNNKEIKFLAGARGPVTILTSFTIMDIFFSSLVARV